MMFLSRYRHQQTVRAVPFAAVKPKEREKYKKDKFVAFLSLTEKKIKKNQK